MPGREPTATSGNNDLYTSAAAVRQKKGSTGVAVDEAYDVDAGAGDGNDSDDTDTGYGWNAGPLYEAVGVGAGPGGLGAKPDGATYDFADAAGAVGGAGDATYDFATEAGVVGGAGDATYDFADAAGAGAVGGEGDATYDFADAAGVVGGAGDATYDFGDGGGFGFPDHDKDNTEEYLDIVATDETRRTKFLEELAGWLKSAPRSLEIEISTLENAYIAAEKSYENSDSTTDADHTAEALYALATQQEGEQYYDTGKSGNLGLRAQPELYDNMDQVQSDLDEMALQKQAHEAVLRAKVGEMAPIIASVLVTLQYAIQDEALRGMVAGIIAEEIIQQSQHDNQVDYSVFDAMANQGNSTYEAAYCLATDMSAVDHVYAGVSYKQLQSGAGEYATPDQYGYVALNAAMQMLSRLAASRRARAELPTMANFGSRVRDAIMLPFFDAWSQDKKTEPQAQNTYRDIRRRAKAAFMEWDKEQGVEAFPGDLVGDRKPRPVTFSDIQVSELVENITKELGKSGGSLIAFNKKKNSQCTVQMVVAFVVSMEAYFHLNPLHISDAECEESIYQVTSAAALPDQNYFVNWTTQQLAEYYNTTPDEFLVPYCSNTLPEDRAAVFAVAINKTNTADPTNAALLAGFNIASYARKKSAVFYGDRQRLPSDSAISGSSTQSSPQHANRENAILPEGLQNVFAKYGLSDEKCLWLFLETLHFVQQVRADYEGIYNGKKQLSVDAEKALMGSFVETMVAHMLDETQSNKTAYSVARESDPADATNIKYTILEFGVPGQQSAQPQQARGFSIRNLSRKKGTSVAPLSIHGMDSSDADTDTNAMSFSNPVYAASSSDTQIVFSRNFDASSAEYGDACIVTQPVATLKSTDYMAVDGAYDEVNSDDEGVSTDEDVSTDPKFVPGREDADADVATFVAQVQGLLANQSIQMLINAYAPVGVGSAFAATSALKASGYDTKLAACCCFLWQGYVDNWWNNENTAKRYAARAVTGLAVLGVVGVLVVAATKSCQLGGSCGSDTPLGSTNTTAGAIGTTQAPTLEPTQLPTSAPTQVPTGMPTDAPTGIPTGTPTGVPTTAAPTNIPTNVPTAMPTSAPSDVPTHAPVLPLTPTLSPSLAPTTPAPTTAAPTTAAPTTSAPTGVPTGAPTTPAPTTAAPTTSAPTTAAPTLSPSAAPMPAPSPAPTSAPSSAPTNAPSQAPTSGPTFSPTLFSTTAAPTKAPSAAPTAPPTSAPVTTTQPATTTTEPATNAAGYTDCTLFTCQEARDRRLCFCEFSVKNPNPDKIPACKFFPTCW